MGLKSSWILIGIILLVVGLLVQSDFFASLLNILGWIIAVIGIVVIVIGLVSLITGRNRGG